MAGLISDQLIENLRTVAYKQLITPCVIKRATREENDYGTTETWATVVETTCWYKPSYKAKTEAMVGFIGREENAEIRLRWETDVIPGDRIEVAGVTFLVQDTNVGATIALYMKAYVEWVT